MEFETIIDGIEFYRDGDNLYSRHYNTIPRRDFIKISGKLWCCESKKIVRNWFSSYTDCEWGPITTAMLHDDSEL